MSAGIQRGTIGGMIEPHLPDPHPKKETVASEEPKPASMSADETGQASFPASDPPAAWTWEVNTGPSGIEAD
jgi:hypothetical protein